MKKLGFLFALIVAGVRLNAADINDLAWMAGSWIEKKGGVETEEHWIAPKGGMILGMNRVTRANGNASFEFSRLAVKDGKITYFASPEGRAATEFPLEESSSKKAIFENPTHDYPQRVTYWIDGDTLRARIEGTVKGQTRAREWTFQSAKP